MWSVLVVDGSPFIEDGLDLGEGVPLAVGGEDLFDQGEVEPFFFAEGLGMSGSSMDDPDSEVGEPHFEGCPPERGVG